MRPRRGCRRDGRRIIRPCRRIRGTRKRIMRRCCHRQRENSTVNRLAAWSGEVLLGSGSPQSGGVLGRVAAQGTCRELCCRRLFGDGQVLEQHPNTIPPRSSPGIMNIRRVADFQQKEATDVTILVPRPQSPSSARKTFVLVAL